jgi:orotate phosphoribosyltransferase
MKFWRPGVHDLVAKYLEAGILQFGRFEKENGNFWPLSLNFLLLPSFPALMQATARALLPLIKEAAPERLLTTRAAIPLGAVLAVESGIPLTYPYGEATAVTNAFVIEGAYDVGHPTTLLAYTLTDSADALDLLAPARRVGLHIDTVLCLFAIGEAGRVALAEAGIRTVCLFDLSTELTGLESKGLIPANLRANVLNWLGTSPDKVEK